MQYFFLGGRGRLARSLAAEYSDADVELLPRETYEGWGQLGACNEIETFFESRSNGNPSTIFIASGLLDPRLPSKDLELVNYFLPRNVIGAATHLGLRVVTFGTVMEAPGLTKNRYIDSKIRLANYVGDRAAQGSLVIHLRCHTHFGFARPSPFMFLGQLLESLNSNRKFMMSSGMQLREFHHLADESAAIRTILDSPRSGVFTISHARPVTLRAVAEAVLKEFGRPELLALNQLPDAPKENYSKIFSQAEEIREIKFRETIPALVDYLRSNR